VKPSTVLFLLEFEHCVENVYFKLWQNIHVVNEKYKQFVTFLQRNNIININNINKCNAIKMLQICEKDSLINCKLLATVLNNIVYDGLQKMVIECVKLKKKDTVLKTIETAKAQIPFSPLHLFYNSIGDKRSNQIRVT